MTSEAHFSYIEGGISVWEAVLTRVSTGYPGPPRILVKTSLDPVGVFLAAHSEHQMNEITSVSLSPFINGLYHVLCTYSQALQHSTNPCFSFPQHLSTV